MDTQTEENTCRFANEQKTLKFLKDRIVLKKVYYFYFFFYFNIFRFSF